MYYSYAILTECLLKSRQLRCINITNRLNWDALFKLDSNYKLFVAKSIIYSIEGIRDDFSHDLYSSNRSLSAVCTMSVSAAFYEMSATERGSTHCLRIEKFLKTLVLVRIAYLRGLEFSSNYTCDNCHCEKRGIDSLWFYYMRE